MDDREARVAENESRFRLVNERIRAVVSQEGPEAVAEDVGIICECGRATCTDKVSLPLAVYEWTRESSPRFVVSPGHDLPDLERVVRHGDGFSIVEKVGEAQQLTADLDPRR